MDDLDGLLDANRAFYRAFNERDVGAMDALWDDQGDVLCVHPGWPALVGRNAVMESWRRILANPEQGRLVAREDRVFLTGGIGVVLCRELAGGTPVLATNLFVLRGGAWRLFHHHASPVAGF